MDPIKLFRFKPFKPEGGSIGITQRIRIRELVLKVEGRPQIQDKNKLCEENFKSIKPCGLILFPKYRGILIIHLQVAIEQHHECFLQQRQVELN